MSALQALFGALVILSVFASFAKFALLMRLNQHLRVHHRHVWEQLSVLDGPGLFNLPVLGFVTSGKFRGVADAKVQRLAHSVVWLRRGFVAAWVLALGVLCWFAWVRSAA